MARAPRPKSGVHKIEFFVSERQGETMRAIARGRPLKLNQYQWKTFEALRQRGIVAGNPDAPELTEYGVLVLRVMDTHARNVGRVSPRRRFSSIGRPR